MRVALSVGLAAALTLVEGREARAAAPCAPDQSRIEVTIEGGADRLAPAILEELDAELGRAHLCASAPGDRSKPLARIRVTLHEGAAASIRIEDAVTKKTVERAVDVADLPADGRALPIAIAADELLRASWAEVSLRPEVENAKEPVPPVVRASVAPPKLPPPFVRRTELGLRATVNVYGGGQTHLGGALYARRDLGSWITGEAFGYAREAMPVTAADGSIRTHAWGGGLSLDLHLLRAGVARFGVKAGAELGYVLFEGARAPEPAPPSSAASSPSGTSARSARSTPAPCASPRRSSVSRPSAARPRSTAPRPRPAWAAPAPRPRSAPGWRSDAIRRARSALHERRARARLQQRGRGARAR